MIGLLGKKIGMTQLFEEDGRQVPVTVIQAGPCIVSNIRSSDKNGYTAVQLAFDPAKEKHVTKPKAGQFKKLKLGLHRFVKEIRTNEVEGLEIGTTLTVDNFEVGEFVDISGVSIGKGFQGVVKRHHFKGGEKAHGSKFGREPGSTGASAYPSRVIKGLGMPGQMGNENVTVQNLKVVQVNAEDNLLLVRGAVPGKQGYLVIKSALKKTKSPKKWKLASSKETKDGGAEKSEEVSSKDVS